MSGAGLWGGPVRIRFPCRAPIGPPDWAFAALQVAQGGMQRDFAALQGALGGCYWYTSVIVSGVRAGVTAAAADASPAEALVMAFECRCKGPAGCGRGIQMPGRPPSGPWRGIGITMSAPEGWLIWETNAGAGAMVAFATAQKVVAKGLGWVVATQKGERQGPGWVCEGAEEYSERPRWVCGGAYDDPRSYNKISVIGGARSCRSWWKEISGARRS